MIGNRRESGRSILVDLPSLHPLLHLTSTTGSKSSVGDSKTLDDRKIQQLAPPEENIQHQALLLSPTATMK